VLGFAEQNEVSAHVQACERVQEALKTHFRPELINRIDEVIVFRELSQETLCKIASHMLSEVVRRAEAIGLDLRIADDVPQYVVSSVAGENRGARPLRRAVSRLIEDTLASALLDGSVKHGDAVLIEVANGSIQLRKEK
jgi:ATP-dependent Clp protease ATP-binding subunit ClpC